MRLARSNPGDAGLFRANQPTPNAAARPMRARLVIRRTTRGDDLMSVPDDLMSVSDIEYAVENRIGVNPASVTEAMLREAGMLGQVFVLPEKLNDRARYIAGVLVQMLGIGCPIDGDLRFASGVLCQALSYLVNSKSWRDGELHVFDREELRMKVGRLGVSS